MNKKQLFFMWCGIATIVFFTLLFYPRLFRGDLQEWLQRIFLIVLVTVGLIYTFKNNSRVQDEQQKPLNIRRGFRRITILLSIIVWLVCSSFVGVIWYEQQRLYERDKKHYDGIVSFWSIWDSNRWEDHKKEVIQYLLDSPDGNRLAHLYHNVPDGLSFYVVTYEVFPNIEKEMLDMPIESLDEKAKSAKELALQRAEKRLKNHERWANKSLPVIICLSILAALPAGVVSFIVLWFIYFLIRWLKLGFRIDTS